MIDEFFGHIARVTSINMLNLAIIDALNVMTPTEVIDMTTAMHHEDWRFPGKVPAERIEEFTDNARAIVSHTVRAMYNAGKPAPERYTRFMLTEGVRIFAGTTEPAGRVLIVAFPGNGGRLMMPLPIILQHFSPGQVDVVMVPDWKKANYRFGIPPLGNTLEEALPKLSKHLPGGYARIVTLGTSSGGIPALLAAPIVGADTVLAVGAGSLDDVRWAKGNGRSKRQLMEAAAPGLAGRRVTLAYGAQSPEDEVSADVLTRLVPHAEKVKVAFDDTEVKHVALLPLVNREMLRPFFEKYLGLH
ncbi:MULTISPECIES: hypothetical protein [unclassified Devosia]|uniref:hypothetical protein n=1 Tax=unclassified Devosia TaxID=196773 RepID=UPI000869AA00|nr:MULTISPECIES: hypothetical protein [unclassified Devosia]MBN9360930.1 hypothetical protein [Devosia sp.]ODS86219.1 MAG: hypothetical protein ABS47_14720 [Devosia sp. SCN 66-27]OJX22873.1 MAG: hypothetical protein BGO83_19070 [Devosia sp. 66-14]